MICARKGLDRKGRAVALLLAAVTVLAGCGADEPPADAGEPPLEQMLMIEDMKAFALPLDAYILSGRRYELFRDARAALQVECMALFGFDVVPPVVPPMPLGINERRYGITSEQEASRAGYRSLAMNARERPKEPELSPAALTVLTGEGQTMIDGKEVPPGGCRAEALRKLSSGGPNPIEDQLAPRLQAEAYAKSMQDSRVRKAFADWSTCMTRSGYRYSDPMAPNDDPSFATPTPGRAEIATAVADTKCKQEANLVNIWASVESAYQKRLIESNAKELDAVKAELELQLRKAATIVGAR